MGLSKRGAGPPEKVDGDELFRTCMRRTTGAVINATDVFTYCRSPFQLYCKYFADPSHRDPEPDRYLESLKDAGIAHEDRIRKESFPGAATIKFATPEDGFKLVINEMIKGTNAMFGAPLFYLPDRMYGVMDQVVRTDGRSVFGPYRYVVKEVKIARNIKRPHILQAVFYNHILGKIQGHTPAAFYIINMDGEEKRFSFSNYAADLFRAIRDVTEIRNGAAPSPTYGSCGYPWSEYCNKRAWKRGICR